MKPLITTIASLALLVGCASKQEKSDNARAPAPTNQAVAGNAEKPAQGRATPATKGDEKTDGRPVEFTCLGLSADKTHFSYRVKVNTDKPISQVDIELRSVADKGKSSTDTVIWQNIVKSTQQPIKKGKTYDADASVEEGTTRVECQLKRVVFADDTTWSPK
jgi:hypothetical protein